MEYEGGCACREIRYRLNKPPMVVHCCHCHWCQRETGAAFALNAMIETSQLKLLCGQADKIDIPSESGKGQQISRCPSCKVALWSHYSGAGYLLSFVRVGTLDNPDVCPPDIHIFTSSKQSWVVLPSGTPAFEEYYRRSEVLSAECLKRLSNLSTAG